MTFSPMLASADVCETHLYRTGGMVQPKLDGIRAVWCPETQALYTRNGNKITSCDHIVAAIKQTTASNPEFNANWQASGWRLDGEIYHHDLSFQQINALVNSKTSGEAQQVLQFHIFDIANRRDNFFRLQQVGFIHENAIVKTVKRGHISCKLDFDRYYQRTLKAGYEGIIWRSFSGRYEYGKRSKGLVKVKPVQDTEAELIGFETTRSGKNADTFSALKLRMPNGIEFRCAGLSDHDHELIWLTRPLGAAVTVHYDSLTQRGAPRHPRFKDIRHDLFN